MAEFPHLVPKSVERGLGGRKGKRKLLELASTKENSEPKAKLHSWRDCRDWSSRGGHEGCRAGNSYHIVIHLSYLAGQKTCGSWRMTVDYRKLSKRMTLIAAPVPDVVSLLEQINTSVT